MASFVERVLIKIEADAKGVKSEVDNLKKSFADANGGMGKLKAASSGLGKVASAAFSPTAITAVGAAALKAVGSFQQLGLTIGKVRDATGLSAQAASRWVEVADDAGVSAETFASTVGKLEKNLATNSAAFQQWGVDVVKAADGTVDMNATLLAAIDTLNAIEDPIQRQKAGFDIFGKSWASMSELISRGSGQLRSDLASVQPSKVFTDKDIDQSRELRDAFDQIKDAMEGVVLSVGKSLAPIIADLAPVISDVVDALGPFVEMIGKGIAAAVRESKKSIEAWTNLLQGVADDAGASYVKLGTDFGDFSVGIIHDIKAGVNPALGELAAQNLATAKAHGFLTDAQKKQNAETQAATDRLTEWTDELARHFLAVANASQDVKELGESFSQIDIKQNALANIFKLGTGPRDFKSNARDISKSIDELGDKAKGVKIGEALANSVKADDFLDAIDSVAPQIQQQITETFSTAGPDAAIAMANSYIDQVTKELGGKFTREQVATMLGLDDITATINAAVTQSSIDEARHKLEILTGITGETPWTATIDLALTAGLITPDAAQALIDAQLRGQGVKVPINPEIGPEDMAEARAFAQANHIPWPIDLTVAGSGGGTKRQSLLNGGDGGFDGIEIPVSADTGDAEDDVDDFREKVERDEATIRVLADLSRAATTLQGFVQTKWQAMVTADAETRGADAELNALTHPRPAPIIADLNDASASTVERQMAQLTRDRTVNILVKQWTGANGGTVPTGGGLAGEAGAEFIELPDGRRLLLTGPTPVPAGTKVTSARRTRQLLRGHVPNYANGTRSQPVLTAAAKVALDTRNVERQIAQLLRARPLRLQAQVVPTTTLVRVNGGG